MPHGGFQVLVGEKISQTVLGEVCFRESVEELLSKVDLVFLALRTQVLDGLDLADLEVESLEPGVAEHGLREDLVQSGHDPVGQQGDLKNTKTAEFLPNFS